MPIIKRCQINTSISIAYFIFMLPISLVYAEGKVVTGTDEDAQLPYWEWQSDAMSIRLVQRLPDQSRAYFMARGFNKFHANRIAMSCIFQTVYKNTARPGSQSVIEYDLSKWKVEYDGKSQPLKLREHWEQEWIKSDVTRSAQIAFQWSLLPTRQQYQPQDYNWGMTSFGIPPATKFDLVMVWKHNSVEIMARINNIECAPDVHIEPKEPFG